MVTGSLARRYAKALLAIGVSDNNFEQLGKEVANVAAAFDSSLELVSALTNPLFSEDNRRAVLDELGKKLGVSPMVHNFLMLLFDKNRLPALTSIARVLATLIDEHAGRVRAIVTSAQPLSADLTAKVQSGLEKQSGKQVVLEKREDPSMIGGLTTQLGDMVFDGSVRTQLEKMREQLLTQ